MAGTMTAANTRYDQLIVSDDLPAAPESETQDWHDFEGGPDSSMFNQHHLAHAENGVPATAAATTAAALTATATERPACPLCGATFASVTTLQLHVDAELAAMDGAKASGVGGAGSARAKAAVTVVDRVRGPSPVSGQRPGQQVASIFHRQRAGGGSTVPLPPAAQARDAQARDAAAGSGLSSFLSCAVNEAKRNPREQPMLLNIRRHAAPSDRPGPLFRQQLAAAGGTRRATMATGSSSSAAGSSAAAAAASSTSSSSSSSSSSSAAYVMSAHPRRQAAAAGSKYAPLPVGPTGGGVGGGADAGDDDCEFLSALRQVRAASLVDADSNNAVGADSRVWAAAPAALGRGKERDATRTPRAKTRRSAAKSSAKSTVKRARTPGSGRGGFRRGKNGWYRARGGASGAADSTPTPGGRSRGGGGRGRGRRKSFTSVSTNVDHYGEAEILYGGDLAAARDGGGLEWESVNGGMSLNGIE
jgi:hypothetical protein